MNTQITKNKSGYTDNSLANRVLHLEKILQQLLNILTNGGQIDNPPLKIDGNRQNNLLSDLILPTATKTDRTNSSPNNQIKKTGISMSRGQTIAELALSIARANGRNS